MEFAVGYFDVHAVERDVSHLRGLEDLADIGDLQQPCLRSSANNSDTERR